MSDRVQNKRKRILTGDTPTGKLHIGHYVGALENRIKLQYEFETYIILANVHAYANYYSDSEQINNNVYNVFLDNLAVGVDPNIATIFLESGIPELFELYTFFLTMVKHSRVIRNPSVKEEIKYKKFDPSVGFVVYPILQAADILGFNADLVPVGEDQLPMIEQAREIAGDFNKSFGETFVVPQAKVGRVARLVGIDGTLKMSKSGKNAILLSEDEETLKQKVMSIYTDPNRVHASDAGRVRDNPVFIYHDAFNPDKAEVEDLKIRYRVGKVGDIEVKEKLFIALNNFLRPIREKRKYYEERPRLAKEILIEGTKRARKVVVETTERVKDRTRLNSLLK
jgi:tryptophanyl-tRNA synthetase